MAFTGCEVGLRRHRVRRKSSQTPVLNGCASNWLASVAKRRLERRAGHGVPGFCTQMFTRFGIDCGPISSRVFVLKVE